MPETVQDPGPASSETARLFLALPLPEAVRTEIDRAQRQLRQAAPESRIRWSQPEQFHLTLKFLGNVLVAQIEPLTETVRQVCRGFAPLRLRAQGIGSFPNWRFPRVIWVGIQDPKAALARLQSELETATHPFSAEEREPNFSGHITLGRVKAIGRPQAEALAKLSGGLAERCFGEWRATEVQLFESQLGPQGAQHALLSNMPLEQGPVD